VFVDECHRTQSGELHKAMKALLPERDVHRLHRHAAAEGRQADQHRGLRPLHPHLQVRRGGADGVVLDLRYEARDIDQKLTSQKKIDEWFEAKTKGLNDLAKAQLKQRGAPCRRCCPARPAGAHRRRHPARHGDQAAPDGRRGNAMLVAAASTRRASSTSCSPRRLKGKCAIVTSYNPSHRRHQGRDDRRGRDRQAAQVRHLPPDAGRLVQRAGREGDGKVEKFEKAVKKKFIDEPGQMKLLIVVDKLLTGFDAPSATYLYIDKQMRDHGLFQAICRVNRLDGDDKEYGYIVDYKDLFKSLEGAVEDYTSGALDGYDKEDVKGLLETGWRRRARIGRCPRGGQGAVRAGGAAADSAAYLHYFCAKESGNAEQLKANEPKRLKLYKFVAPCCAPTPTSPARWPRPGYTREARSSDSRPRSITSSRMRDEVKLNSGDYIDLKQYEPAMRHLIDTYIRAEETARRSPPSTTCR
jgi:type I restriction enzyme R subunit